MLRKIIGILTPAERLKMGLLMLLDIFISVADILFLACLLFIIQFYTGSMPAKKVSFLPAALTSRDPLLLIGIFFLLFSLKNLAGFLVYRSQCRYIFGVASRISRKRLLYYLEGAWSGYINTDSSVQIREISYQPLEFSQHILGGLQQILTQSILILLTIVAIIAFNGKLFLLLLIILLPPTFVIFYLIKSKLRSAGINARASSERSLQHLQEALAGYVESNIYDKNKVFLNRYIIHQDRFNQYISDHTIMMGIPARMIEVFSLLGIVILVAINKVYGHADQTAIITIGVFMAAAYKIIPGIVKILNLSGQVSSYAYTVQGLAQADEAAAAPEEPEKSGGVMPGGDVVQVASVCFKDVAFSYGDRPVLQGQDLQLSTGDFVGISGVSGKGKTTILHLLLGFLTPDKGSILINDLVTASHDRRRYWPKISYVKQQPFLIHDTILQNITLNGRVYDDGKFQQALSVAGLAGVIDGFPEKWEKVIAENGKNISGGQKQRIAIARALYKDADLIILDEPFNELDEDSENSLLRHFQQLSQTGKLIILITHNKKSLRFCNKIVSLDED